MHQNPAMRKSVLFLDEAAQMFRLFRTESGADLKEAMLMAYDGRARTTTKKDGTIILNDISLSFVGATVTDTFINLISPEDLLDGMMQRFMMIKCEQRNERNMKNWPYEYQAWQREEVQIMWQQWIKNVDTIKHFDLSPDAKDLWQQWYREHFNTEWESHYKRYLWSTLKLSAIFCSMRPEQQNPGKILREDMAWAIRALDQALESLFDVMDRHMHFDKWEQFVQRVRGWLDVHPDVTDTRGMLRGLRVSKIELERALGILKDRGQYPPGVENAKI
jgi:hypothetical protein